VLPGERGTFLELKAPGGRVSPEQRRFIEHVAAIGCLSAESDNVDQAVAVLRSWGPIRAPIANINHPATAVSPHRTTDPAGLLWHGDRRYVSVADRALLRIGLAAGLAGTVLILTGMLIMTIDLLSRDWPRRIPFCPGALYAHASR
jgi:hypothetical protein